MNEAFIISSKRSAVGKYGGSLASLIITDIAAQVITDTLSSFSPHLPDIDEVIIGNTLSAGIGQNPARITAYKAGISYSVPATTVNTVCGSGLKSIILAAQNIALDEANVIIAGGMESMSQCPYYVHNYRFGAKFGHQMISDGMITDGLWCALTDQHMGKTAENIAKKYHISRIMQDNYAYNSHRKTLAAQNNKSFIEEITPITIKTDKGEIQFATDEQPRADTTVERLAQLKPVFTKDGTVTAGNASTLNDAAAIAVVASEGYLNKNKIKPKARILSYASIGLDPNFMGLGAYYAAVNCAKKIGFKLNKVDLWEINEAFAVQTLAVIKLLDIDPEKVNIHGGAIALGHPIGASGTRIITSLINSLHEKNLKYGMATVCVGGGQGVALLLENLQ